MTNNDIFGRIRHTFDLNDAAVIEIFALADFSATPEQLGSWSKAADEEGFAGLSDTELAVFLNGFITLKRGRREGEQPKPEDHLNNNMIFQKLRIALNLKAEDVLAVFQNVDISLSKHEISAFFRKPGNKHYRECKDETLQAFLQGISGQPESGDND